MVVGTSQSGVLAYQIPGSANARVLWGTARGNRLRNGLAASSDPVFANGYE